MSHKTRMHTKDYKHLTMAQSELFEKLVYQTYHTKSGNAKNIHVEIKKTLQSHGIYLTNSSYNMQVSRLLTKYKAHDLNMNLHGITTSSKIKHPLINDEDISKMDISDLYPRVLREDPIVVKDKPVIAKLPKKKNLKKEKNPAQRQYTLGNTMKHQARKEVYSTGEQMIAQELKNLLVPYIHEATIEGLVSENNRDIELPCDFILDVNGHLAMIEYNGQQHYQDITNNLTYYSRLITNDNRRLTFAIATGIPFLVISYKDHALKDISHIVKEFVSDIQSDNIQSKKYSDFTYGYFGKYSSDNEKRYQKLFPHPQYPSLITNHEFGYIEINKEQILIWDKDKLMNLINDNKNLQGRCDAYSKQNKELSKQLTDTTNLLQQANQRIKSYEVS